MASGGDVAKQSHEAGGEGDCDEADQQYEAESDDDVEPEEARGGLAVDVPAGANFFDVVDEAVEVGKAQASDEVVDEEAEQHDERDGREKLSDPFGREGEGHVEFGAVARVVAAGIEIAIASEAFGEQRDEAE